MIYGMADSASRSFEVDGNYGGTGSPAVSILGPHSDIRFYTSETGNTAAQLPSSSIFRSEIGDEPGVASAYNDGTVALSGGTYDTVIAAVLNAPTSTGYIFAIAHCYVAVNHTYGATSTATMGLAAKGQALPPAQDVNIQIPSGAATGYYYWPVSLTWLYPVTSAGPKTIELRAYEGSGDAVSVADIWMNLMFFPTAYGTAPVPGSYATSSSADTDDSHVSFGLTSADKAILEAEAIAQNAARLEQELEEIRAQVEAMKAKYGEQPAEADTPDWEW
jgi:hypothetical protein